MKQDPDIVSFVFVVIYISIILICVIGCIMSGGLPANPNPDSDMLIVPNGSGGFLYIP